MESVNLTTLRNAIAVVFKRKSWLSTSRGLSKMGNISSMALGIMATSYYAPATSWVLY